MNITTVIATIISAVVATRTKELRPRQTSTASASLPVVSVKGNAFFMNGERFYIRGVAYQPGGAADAADPLLDIAALTRDVANFVDLGINTVRVYTVDNSASHDEGMKILADAGIYLALDVNTPEFSLNRASNATLYQSYNEKYLQSVFATIDAFASFSNLLLLINGNEVINERNNTIAAPYIKAVNRDMKRYISARGYRSIPVGYAAADVAENINEQLRYFDCGPDAVRGDFFGLNDYSWCNPSSFTISGWDKKVERYSGYGVPIFMAEYGCNTNTRTWGEVASLYSSNMTSVYSGGLAYEYTAEPNGYGLVDSSFTPNDDFDRLKAAFKATSNPTGDGGYSASTSASQCPAQSDDWEVANTLIPDIPKLAEKYMAEGAGKGPGLGDDVTPSQYGGESYSAKLVEMNDTESTATSTASGSSSTSTMKSDAVTLLEPVKALFGLPVVVSFLELLMGLEWVL